MIHDEIIRWLLEGDVAIRYQVERDLLNREQENLRQRIEQEGWGAAFMARRRADGHWGQRYYQPKWISTHYTLMDLRNLCISPEQAETRESVGIVIRNQKGQDGGINPSVTRSRS